MVFYQGGRQVVQNPIHIDVFEYPARYQAGGVFLYPTWPAGHSNSNPNQSQHHNHQIIRVDVKNPAVSGN